MTDVSAIDRRAFVHALTRLVGRDRVGERVPLAPFTTFDVGGPADWMVDARSADEVRRLMRCAADAGIPVTVIGGGSNVLVSDAGVRGLVLRLHLTAIAHVSAEVVRAEAGVTINGLVRWTISRGLAGVEAWAGTPGTVGGAIYGNAHWSGRNISDVVTRVGLLAPGGEWLEVPRSEMGFAYDTSRLHQTREIVVWADFGVTAGDSTTLRQRARESLAFRKRTQPLALPSAGCIFQNPDPARDPVPDGIPCSAGALIDRAGLKGHQVGGASISTTHANFIVNHGTATAADIRRLIETARDAVRDRFGVTLRDEVVYLGTFQHG